MHYDILDAEIKCMLLAQIVHWYHIRPMMMQLILVICPTYTGMRFFFFSPKSSLRRQFVLLSLHPKLVQGPAFLPAMSWNIFERKLFTEGELLKVAKEVRLISLFGARCLCSLMQMRVLGC